MTWTRYRSRHYKTPTDSRNDSPLYWNAWLYYDSDVYGNWKNVSI